MEAHGVRERAREKVVVADRDFGEDTGEAALLVWSQVEDRGDVSAVREHFPGIKKFNEKIK